LRANLHWKELSGLIAQKLEYQYWEEGKRTEKRESETARKRESEKADRCSAQFSAV